MSLLQQIQTMLVLPRDYFTEKNTYTLKEKNWVQILKNDVPLWQHVHNAAPQFPTPVLNNVLDLFNGSSGLSQ